MLSRSPSLGTAVAGGAGGRGGERRLSGGSWISFAGSSAERGDGEAGEGARSGATADQQIEEEIAEIKRYEDFTTIDWVQDSIREEQRRKAQRQRRETDGSGRRGGRDSIYPGAVWRARVGGWYDAAQGWLVVTLIGVAIGLNAALLNIVTEWLSDVKMGYCRTAFYLNENFCCWGEEPGQCRDWQPWTSWGPVANYVVYLVFAVLFASTSAVLVRSFAPYAAGSGISEIKCIIAGFNMKGFLGLRTLAIKSIGLPLAIASGLSVGKEGPSVHYAVCTGSVVSRLFGRYRRSASSTRDILCACAAAGVAVAFGSPIGGVLFSLEEMSTSLSASLKTLWRSYFCALVATAVLAAMNPFRTGQLVMFQVHYDHSWHFFETAFYVVIGVFGGLYGAFVIKWNLRAQAFRKRYLAPYAVLEATLLAALTALVCYPNAFLRIDMTESMEILFLECDRAEEDYQGLCDAQNRLWNLLALLGATVLRVLLVVVSYGCKVPAGIFVPSMAVGASFGRSVGILVQALHEAYPGSVFFAACTPDEPCITPGTYAFLGAAAALSGIMHLTVSVVVIMFELTGALTYILPTMIVVGVTKAVSDLFGRGGIADRMIWFSGFPFLDNKEDHNFGVPVSDAMTSHDLATLPAAGLTLAAVEQLLADDSQGTYQGFPVVDAAGRDLDPVRGDQGRAPLPILVGYLGRTELRYAVERFRKDAAAAAATTAATESPSPESRPDLGATRCFFALDTPSAASAHAAALASSAVVADFTRYVDRTPVTVHPRLPLETVMELFQKVGPRVILVEYHGHLSGLITVKDCLKYQFKAENSDNNNINNNNNNNSNNNAQEQIWTAMCHVAGWVADKAHGLSGGRIRLHQEGGSRGGGGIGVGGVGSVGSGTESDILDGTEDVEEEGLELESR